MGYLSIHEQYYSFAVFVLILHINKRDHKSKATRSKKEKKKEINFKKLRHVLNLKFNLILNKIGKVKCWLYTLPLRSSILETFINYINEVDTFSGFGGKVKIYTE